MYLDCKKKPCPQPVVLSLKALKTLKKGEPLEVEVDNRAAVENLKRMADEKKCTVTVKELEHSWVLTLIRTEDAGEDLQSEDTEALKYCSPESLAPRTEGPLVIAIGTAEMGQGDPALGKILMKSFLYSLDQLEDPDLPKTIFFFNGGAKLTTEGSESIADIRDLADRGVEILTCGTCLDFYGIKEKLQVGGVTNMYAIAEGMAKAGRVIRI